jgi:hypothetical protein
MHAKGRHGRRKNGSLDRFLVGATSGWKLAAVAVVLIAMTVMGAMGMRRVLGDRESPVLEGGDATSIASPDVPG